MRNENEEKLEKRASALSAVSQLHCWPLAIVIVVVYKAESR